MDECPHCGEPIEEEAESCPHCGSDCETGWKPDADYYSVELPDDDGAYEPQDSSEVPWESLVSLLLVLLCALLGVWLAAKVHGRTVLPFAIVMGFGIWLYYRWLTPRKSARR